MLNAIAFGGCVLHLIHLTDCFPLDFVRGVMF